MKFLATALIDSAHYELKAGRVLVATRLVF